MRCGAVFRPAVETGAGAAGVLEFTVCDEVGLGVAEGAVAAFGFGGGATGNR